LVLASFSALSGIKISITAIAVIENLWAHGRGKFTSKRGSRFCVQIPGTFEKEEKQKNCSEERNGESDRRGDGSSSLIVKKARISVQLQLQLDSLRTRVVSLEAWILQIMVWAIIT
jgi:hypothetical protein